MGQDQSKPDEFFRQNPKFQRNESSGHGSHNASVSETSRRTDAAANVSRSMFSERDNGFQPKPNHSNEAHVEPNSVISSEKQPSCNSNIEELTYQKLNTQSNPLYVVEDNLSIGPSSSVSETFSENPKPDQIQNSSQINFMRELETSPKRQMQQMKNDNSPSKPVLPNNKFQTPERDVRHVPTYNEQIKLNSTVTGNPFLATPDSKSEYIKNESVRQISNHQNRVSNEIEKCRVKEKLESMYHFGIICRSDLDKRALESLENLPEDLALDILNQFDLSNPKTKSNKSAYLCSMIKNKIGGNEILSPMRETKERFSPHSKSTVSPSSQKNLAMYFDYTNATNNDLTNTICDVNEEETNNVYSRVSLLPKEVIGDNISSIKDKYSSGSISVKNIMASNTNYTGNVVPLKEDILKSVQAENLLSYEETLTNSSEQSPSKITVEQNLRRSRLAPRFQEQKQFKRNLSKSVGLKGHSKTSTCNALKDIDRLAESLSSINKCSDISNNTLIKENISANISLVDRKNKHLNSSIEECILQMTNVELQPKETLTLLQKNVCSNLEIINNFISILKTFPFLSEEIDYQVNILKENAMSFPVNRNCSYLNSNPFASHASSDFSVDKTNFTNPEIKKSLSNNLLAPSIISEKAEQSEYSTSNITSISLNSFKALLDDLPLEYESEKKNIFFDENNIYCLICDNSVEFDLLSLITHFNTKNHQKYLSVNNSLPSIPKDNATSKIECSKQLSFNKNKSKENITEIETNKYEQTLGKNHQGILDIVYKSCKNSCVLDKTFYICVPCDFWSSENDLAMNHVKSDKTHINRQIENANWHTCYSCGIIMYATENNLHDHSLSVLHCNIMEMKQMIPNDKGMSSPNDKAEDRDDVSVCSSKGDLSHLEQKTPHKILLVIVKNRKHRGHLKGIIGMYCRVCNRYFRYDRPYLEANRPDNHIRGHVNIRGRKKYKVFHCSTCHVELIGDRGLWQEHESMEIHKELACEDSSTNQLKESNLDPYVPIGSQELSEEEGPHFDLMKEILKNHLKNESGKDVFGFYCHLCQTYTMEENQWQTHIFSPSHSNRINSSECINRKMLHNCSVCNIKLICNEHIFILHNRSLGHDVVFKLHQSRSDQRGAAGLSQLTKNENDEEVSDNESEDTEDEDDSQSTSSSKHANNENTKFVPTGIKIKGIPPGAEQRDLFQTFKKFGYINNCKLHRSGKVGTIMFGHKEVVKTVLEANDLYINGRKIYVYPLVRKQRGGRRVNEMMSSSVVEILKFKEKLDTLTKGIKAEIAEIGQQRTERSAKIVQDIQNAVPGCKVHIFGSQFTGLATIESDFDIYIDHDGRSYFSELSQKQQETIIHGLLRKFTMPNSGFRVCETVLEARVPILRVVHNRTNIPCDISCRSGLSMENSILTRQLLSSDFRVSWLVIIIKWWMRNNNLLASNKFTSYTTTWLVLFFLMRVQPFIISSILDMREGCPPYSIGYWDCRFNRVANASRHFQKPNCDPQHKLLIDFFKFYGTFNFKNVVLCPLTANVIPRKQFEELKLPPPYIRYIQKVRTVADAERLRTVTAICLQDPFDLSHNIAKGVSRKDLNKFKTFCNQSINICENQWGTLK